VSVEIYYYYYYYFHGKNGGVIDFISLGIHITYTPFTLYPRRGSKGISDIPPRRFYPDDSAMGTSPVRNTADVIDDKPIGSDLIGVLSFLKLITLKSPLTTSMEETEKCYHFVLFRTPLEIF
jgi:hypothetical protein